MTKRILVIDDEEILLKSCTRTLEPLGYEVATTQNPKKGIRLVKSEYFDLVLTDLKMPEISGLDILKEAKENWPDTEVIIITGHGTVNTAVSAMQLGAYDYIEKPFTPDTLSIIVGKALEHKKLFLENMLLRKEIRSHYIQNIIGTSPAIEKVFKLIASVAPTSSTVLITGESGTGKELVARAIHYNSPRDKNPFVVVDCGTISDNLMESELFGHFKGAFTGASETKKGLLDAANTGTLFLDEISNLPPPLQSKLLRVLQEREYRPVGGKKSYQVDIRFIAATNRDLKEMISENAFREDLFYRLNIFPIHVPPLRQRKEDIPLLAHHFIKKFGKEFNRGVDTISTEAMSILLKHDWPGNVRELENTVQRAMLLSESPSIKPEHLTFIEASPSDEIPKNIEELKAVKKNLRERSIENIEKAFIIEALQRNNWNITHAAQDVGMQRTNFHALIRKYNVSMKRESS